MPETASWDYSSIVTKHSMMITLKLAKKEILREN